MCKVIAFPPPIILFFFYQYVVFKVKRYTMMERSKIKYKIQNKIQTI